jgi:starch-binding outer membrane protein, SusD/RagB family
MQNKVYNKTISGLSFVSVAIALLFASCKKYVENGTPPNSISQEKAFVDSATATSVILGLYSLNSSTAATLANNRYGSMSADDAYFLTSSTYDAFKNNTLAAGNDANLIWFNMYTTIGRANFAIEGVQASTTLSTAVKNQLIGEAKFWRAYYYFFLVNFFGDVPLVTTTNALETGLYPRTPVAQVYQQIVTDLTEAKNLLTATYPSIERARINKWAASAFLSRVYFYQQNWAAAEAEAGVVIGSGTYSLETFANSFTKTSNETIWQQANTTGVTGMGPEWIPASTTPTFVLYDTLANAFEAGDQRKVNWAKSIVYNAKTYYYPFKYKLRTGTTGNEYAVMLRLAEMYLIRAEARAQLNTNISGAQSDINAIRTRAGLANTTAATQATLIAAAEKERWVELFTESSDRWFNLKRLNKATATLSLIKPAWQPFQQLYPIPTQELQANPNLVKNPGY